MWVQRRLLGLLVVFVVVLTGCDWTMFHYGPGHQGYSSTETAIGVGNVGTLTTKWVGTTGGIVASSPAIAKGVAHVGSGDGQVYAFNMTTGATLWTAAGGTGSSIGYSSPAVDNGIVYEGLGTVVCVGRCFTYDGLFAFNASTGAILWERSHPTGAIPDEDRTPDSSPTVVNGVAYMGFGEGALYAFNATTGDLLWTKTTGGFVHSSPAVANGVIYIGSDDGKVYAFKASTGARLWTATTGGAVQSSPALANGVVYVGSDDGTVYAFNASTGATLWTATTGGAVQSSPALANGVLYVGSDDGKVYAFGLP